MAIYFNNIATLLAFWFAERTADKTARRAENRLKATRVHLMASRCTFPNRQKFALGNTAKGDKLISPAD